VKRIVNDLGMITLALSLAIIVWVVAVQEENPIEQREYDQPVRVQVRNRPPGTILFPQFNQSVQLKLRAPQSSWRNLRADMFEAWIDLDGKTPDNYQIEVNVTCTDKNVVIVDVYPPTVPVGLRQELERTFTVTLQLNVPVAFGYELKAEQAVIEPLTVTVRGPDSFVADVARVVATLDLRGEVKETIRVNRQLVAQDGAGNSMGNFVTVQPASVNIVVPVEQKTGFKDVAVRPVVIGAPAPGYRLRAIRVEPSIVTLGGDSKVVENVAAVGYVENVPLNIAGATGDMVERLALNLPEGASALGVQGVLVTASIEPIPGRRAISLPPIVKGLSSELMARVMPEKVVITLNGPLPKLNTLTEADVKVYVELVGMGAGQHTVALTFLVPEGIEVESIVPASVEVTILPIPPTSTPTPTPTWTPTPTVAVTETLTPSVSLTPTVSPTAASRPTPKP